ncbi:PucR family transcriptional regulator [Amycolatopsis thermoflava]|uniref:PucR family transcriptional regulator n=1 Tax=Amycolatopsis thermoflava TaxID=84480 RepID=UPI003F49C62A
MTNLRDDEAAPLSALRRLLAVSMTMSEVRHEDAILRFVRTSLPSFAPYRVEATFLHGEDGLLPWPDNAHTDAALAEQIRTLEPAGGLLSGPAGSWRWAFPMASEDTVQGFLVICGDHEPTADSRFLLQVLGRQAGIALAGAAQHRREQDQVTRLRRANDELTRTVSRFERQTSVYEELTSASASGDGEAGIARAVHRLTGLPVAVEDAFGNPLAWAGQHEPPRRANRDARRRQALLEQAIAEDGPVRDHDRVVSVVRPKRDVLGMLVLTDPGRTAGQHELFVAGYATTMLGLELAHQRNLAEVELRVHRDLIDDLITGTDDGSAYARATAIGHDLRVPHFVVVLRWKHPRQENATVLAAQRSLRSSQRHALVSRHAGATVLLVDGSVDGPALHRELGRELGTKTGAIGISSRCDRPADLPRAYSQARQALEIRLASAAPHGATAFDQLGVYRILSSTTNRVDVETFVREWLGPLLDYDAKRHSELVRTLFQYLESGGNYDSAAAALVIHRSTLRYRLARIRDIGKLDLTDVDTRLNLHVAARAWQILQGPTP